MAAVESTGVHWIPVYEILEALHFKVHPINARHVKYVPGRKSDAQGCQWIQHLHNCGLLKGSFRPEGETCALRACLRHRATLLKQRADHIRHMQKALQRIDVIDPDADRHQRRDRAGDHPRDSGG